MTDRSIKQFKLTNDDEIICEVVQWDDEDYANIIIRSALKIINVEDFQKGIRFYAFRPWMLFNDNLETLMTLNGGHIIAEIQPSHDIITRYIKSIASLQEAHSKKSFSLDDVASKAEYMDEDEFEQYMESLAEMDEIPDDDPDSDLPQNIIQFRPKGPMH